MASDEHSERKPEELYSKNRRSSSCAYESFLRLTVKYTKHRSCPAEADQANHRFTDGQVHAVQRKFGK